MAGVIGASALLLVPIHPSAWKVAAEKSAGYLMGAGLIHHAASLCNTTTCRDHPRDVDGLKSHLLASRRAFYARSCKRTSENTPSETVWKMLRGRPSVRLWLQEAA